MSATNIQQGKSPWGRALSPKDIENKVNEVGAASEPPFKFYAHAPPLIYKGKEVLAVEVERLDTKERKVVNFKNIMDGKNPWGGNKKSDKDIEKVVNELGQKNAEPYRFVQILPNKGPYKMVEVESIVREIKVEKELVSLKKGYNPFLRVK